MFYCFGRLNDIGTKNKTFGANLNSTRKKITGTTTLPDLFKKQNLNCQQLRKLG